MQCVSRYETPGVDEIHDSYRLVYIICFYVGLVAHWVALSMMSTFSGKDIFGDFGQTTPYTYYVLGFIFSNIGYIFGYCWMKSDDEFTREFLLFWLQLWSNARSYFPEMSRNIGIKQRRSCRTTSQ